MKNSWKGNVHPRSKPSPGWFVSSKSLLLIEAAASIVGWVVVAMTTVGITLLVFCAFLIHPLTGDRHRKIPHALSTLWGRLLIRLHPGVRVRIAGKENIPQGQPVVFMANHQSYTDIPILCYLRQEFKWVADIGLFKIPFLGWSMCMGGDIAIDREDPRQGREALQKAQSVLSSGISVFVFPEGTRSRTGVFGRFQPGGFRLAAVAGAWIVPVVLVGTRPFLPRGSWVFRLGAKPQIHILPPVRPSGSGMKEIYRFSRRLRSQMMAVYRRHMREAV